MHLGEIWIHLHILYIWVVVFVKLLNEEVVLGGFSYLASCLLFIG